MGSSSPTAITRSTSLTPSAFAEGCVTSPGVVDRNRGRAPTPGDLSASAATGATAFASRGAWSNPASIAAAAAYCARIASSVSSI